MDNYGTKINRVGEVNLNIQGLKMEIVKYTNASDITIQFEDGITIISRQYSQFIKGNILNFNYPSVESIGCIGYGKYSGETHYNILKTWYSMLNRCYGSRYLRTYQGCSVHKDWHNFQNFAEWYEENFKPEFMEHWNLDKDILVP